MSERKPEISIKEYGDDVRRLLGAIESQENAIRSRDAEIAELEADINWSVRHNILLGTRNNGTPCFEFHSDIRGLTRIGEYDGTDAGLRAAIRKARKGGG